MPGVFLAVGGPDPALPEGRPSDVKGSEHLGAGSVEKGFPVAVSLSLDSWRLCP